MRTEQEMMELILSFAKRDERVRAVIMRGSRVNDNVRRDEFQDYDVAYVVTDMESFKKDDGWLDYFGKRIIMQKPEAMVLFPHEVRKTFSYLMLFEDETRIDLTLVPIHDVDVYLTQDTLQKVLLDKDGMISHLSAPNEAKYYIKRPSEAFFNDCCNEFWWVSTYVAKGLCRKEILYALDHLNGNVRPCLLQMLAWKIGIENKFSVNVGKSYKYIERYVPKDMWKRLLSTYENGSYKDVWHSLFECMALFREVSKFVAENLGYVYPDYDEKVSNYITNLYYRYFGNERYGVF